jgi:hypothetical protein
MTAFGRKGHGVFLVSIALEVETMAQSRNRAHRILIRPCEVLSRITNVAILEIAHDALGVLLQHRHVVVGRFV